MFHVKHLICSLLLIFPILGWGQGTVVMEKKAFLVNREKDQTIVKYLSEFPSLSALREEEKEGFYWINLLRKDPAAFSHNYLDPFATQFPELRDSYVKSLRSELLALGPLGMIAPASNVQKEADRHCQDLAKNQRRISHEASDGRSFSQRMSDAGIRYCAGENVFEGDSDALQALLLLLIDQGVPNLGHRKALLNPTFNIMGISVKQATDSTAFIVQVFSCR